ncbi:ParB/RepB/Spo0J family partition protein [Candidatus Shapirobacteria bacterium]|nr:ParB/RepB/Spo0J family partition protein [Candidatus Shapirobacteria bacterium]
MADDQIIKIPVDELQANPLQPRGVITPESIVDLVDSIRVHGVLEPLIVAKTPAGFQIIAGERRWRAAKVVGLKELSCVVRETTPRGMLEMAIVENVQRADLPALERAKAFQRLVDEFGLSSAEIARRVGKSIPYVSNSLRLLALPDAVKDGLVSSLITEGHARALLGIGEPRLIIDAYKVLLREQGTVRRAEDLARRMGTVGKKLAEDTGRDQVVLHEEIDRMREEIAKALGGGKKVQVKLVRSRVKSFITIFIRGDIRQTEAILQKAYRALTGKPHL